MYSNPWNRSDFGGGWHTCCTGTIYAYTHARTVFVHRSVALCLRFVALSLSLYLSHRFLLSFSLPLASERERLLYLLHTNTHNFPYFCAVCACFSILSWLSHRRHFLTWRGVSLRSVWVGSAMIERSNNPSSGSCDADIFFSDFPDNISARARVYICFCFLFLCVFPRFLDFNSPLPRHPPRVSKYFSHSPILSLTANIVVILNTVG